MAPKPDDKDDLVTVGVCNENRAVSRWWLGGFGALALAVGLLVIVPATMAGYRAQINLDLHIAGQKAFEALMLDKVKAVGTKVQVIGAEVDGIGSEVEVIGTKVQVIGAEVKAIGAKVDGFGDRFDIMERKIQTSWDHDNKIINNHKLILELLQKQNASTE